MFALVLLPACATSPEETVDACADPAYTWDTWGAGFFASYCRSCHSAATPNRRGAPEGVDFDTEAQVRTWAAAIARSALDDSTMPIGGGVPAADLERLRAWLACGDGATEYAAPALVAELEASEVSDLAVQVLDAAPLTPFFLHDWLGALMLDLEGRHSGCPSRDVDATDPADWTMYWTGGCTGESVDLEGDLIVYVNLEDGEIRREDVWDLFSVTGRTLPGDEEIVAGGNTLYNWTVAEGQAEVNLFWGGRYHHPGDPGPLGTMLDAGITLLGNFHPEGGYYGSATGGLAAHDAAVDLRALTWVAGCGPSGTFAVRDPSTAWWTVALRDDCSGCGTLRFGDRDAGEVCLGAEVHERLHAELAAAFVEVP